MVHWAGSSREGEVIGYRDTYERAFIMGSGSFDYRGWEVPPYTVCKAKNQEKLWYNSVQVQKPEN